MHTHFEKKTLEYMLDISLEKCVSKCDKGKYKYSAVQGNWCSCGNDTDLSKNKNVYAKVSNNDCKISCAGDIGGYCGDFSNIQSLQ